MTRRTLPAIGRMISTIIVPFMQFFLSAPSLQTVCPENDLIGIHTRHVNVYNFCDQFQSTDMLETSGNQRSLAESRL